MCVCAGDNSTDESACLPLGLLCRLPPLKIKITSKSRDHPLESHLKINSYDCITLFICCIFMNSHPLFMSILLCSYFPDSAVQLDTKSETLYFADIMLMLSNEKQPTFYRFL